MPVRISASAACASRSARDEILRCRHLHVARLALEYRDLEPRPFGERGVVGKIVAPRGRSAAVRVEQHRVGERLRGLHGAQVRAIERRGDEAVVVDQLHRVGDGKRRHRRARFLSRRDRAVDQSGRRERPRRIVHQHDRRAVAGKRLEPGVHRALARRAADRPACARRSPSAASAKRSPSSGWITGSTRSTLGMAGENAQALPNHRGTAHHLVLLGIIEPGCAFRARLPPPPRPRGSPCLPCFLLSNEGFSACVQHRKRLFTALASMGILLHRSTCGTGRNG